MPFDDLERGLGLDVITWMQERGSPLLDALAQMLDFIGGGVNFLVLLPIIYWALDPRLGRRLILVILAGVFAYASLKGLTDRPRPFVTFPDTIEAIAESEGASFPSGHVTIAVVLWGYIAYWVHRWSAAIAVGLYVLVMMWARVYGGVHYPHDVVGGLIVGLVTLGVLILLMPRVVDLWRRSSDAARIGAAAGVALLAVLLIGQDQEAFTSAGIALGSGIGAVIVPRFSATGDHPTRRVLRAVAGVVVLLGVFYILRTLFEPLEPDELWRTLRYTLISLLLVAGWPWLSMRLGWMQQRQTLPNLDHESMAQ